jgi:hypothetical protein
MEGVTVSPIFDSYPDNIGADDLISADELCNGCRPSSVVWPSIVPDRSEAQRFLKLLDPTTDKFTFQTFDDDKDRKNGRLVRIFHGTLTEHFDELTRFNRHGAGVFVTINATDFAGRTTAHIVRVRCLFADFDKRNDTAPITQPQRHMLVKSSPGKWHVYWRVNGIALNDFTRFQLAIIRRYDTDPSVQDLPRVMRLPGFFSPQRAPDHGAHRRGQQHRTL